MRKRRNSLIRSFIALFFAVVLVFFASNADSYSAAPTKCNHTCSFMGCEGGSDECEGAGVRCCDKENLPCTTEETWAVTCYEILDA